MNNTKKIVMSVLVLAMLAALLTGATLAAFTSSSRIGGNSITAGTINVTASLGDVVNGEGNATADVYGLTEDGALTATNIAPGDSCTVRLNITNSGTLAAKYKMFINFSDSGLQDVMNITLNETALGDTFESNWLDIGANASADPTPVLAFSMDAGAGNSYQGKSFTFEIVVYAVQSNGTENVILADSIEDFAAITADGQTVALVKDITTLDDVTLPKIVNIDLNGKTFTAKSFTISDADYTGSIDISNGTITATDGDITVNLPNGTVNLSDNVGVVTTGHNINVTASENTLNILGDSQFKLLTPLALASLSAAMAGDEAAQAIVEAGMAEAPIVIGAGTHVVINSYEPLAISVPATSQGVNIEDIRVGSILDEIIYDIQATDTKANIVLVDSADKLAVAINYADAIKLTADFALTDYATITRNINLDLNGFTISREVKPKTAEANNLRTVFNVDGGKLIIDDTSEGKLGKVLGINNSGASGTSRAVIVNNGELVLNNGALEGGYAGVYVYGNTDATTWATTSIDSKLVVNGGTINGGTVGISYQGKGAKVFVNDGCINNNISGNGSATATTNNGGTYLEINGGTIISASEDGAVYLPQFGSCKISGGTITGTQAVSIKDGSLEITGGTFLSNGAFVETPDINSNGSELTGACINVIGNPAYIILDTEKTDGNIVSIPGQPDSKIVVEISGGSFTSTYGYALFEYNLAEEVLTESITISGGTFTSAAEKAEYYTQNDLITDSRA